MESPIVNPFEPPEARQQPMSVSTQKLPIYSITVLIIDLVFRGIRLLLVGLTIVGIAALSSQGQNLSMAYLELFSGAAMVLFGGVGDVLLLCKVRFGAYLCWAAILATLANMGVGLMQLPAQLERMEVMPPQGADVEVLKMVAWISAGAVILFRLTLVIMYAVAVQMAGRALRK
jgi:hypothetical protein